MADTTKAVYAPNPIVTVSGIALPEPSTYSANTATIVDGGRNANGKFIGNIIRNDVAKVELSWNYLPVDEWAKICSLFDSSFVNSVRFFAQNTNSYVTRQMYVNDRNANLFRRDPKTGSILGWLNPKLALIQV